MKYYLIALIFVIMAAGGRTMFEIAFHGMAKEHDAAPGMETGVLMLLAVYYMLMMVCAILLLFYKNVSNRNIWIALLSAAIFGPTIYMALTR